MVAIEFLQGSSADLASRNPGLWTFVSKVQGPMTTEDSNALCFLDSVVDGGGMNGGPDRFASPKAMLKIEVFGALQTRRFGSSEYTFNTQPQIANEDVVTKFCSRQEAMSVGRCHYKEWS